ncbi:MAG: DNA-binding protein, partial [bacterium]|nr:DNA-binding protein [bacterium]
VPGSEALQAQQKKTLLEPAVHRGKVLSTMNSGGYTYIEFQENGKTLWVACRQTTVTAGETIEFSKGAPMKNFHSRTLKRTFDSILFVSRVARIGVKDAKGNGTGTPKTPAALPKMPKGHIPVGPKAAQKIAPPPGSVKKAENGYTVAECYGKKDSLPGKTISVRGRVVKFSAKIMGRNWIHLRDGSGKTGTNDLTVTTGAMVRVGDLVVVTGKISYKKDFGSGYVFPAIIEEASITIE